jgi:hypothetical protein
MSDLAGSVSIVIKPLTEGFLTTITIQSQRPLVAQELCQIAEYFASSVTGTLQPT